MRRGADKGTSGLQKEDEHISFDAYDCCHCAVKMHEGRHDFMARVRDEIVVSKDVPALICDTCGEVEYTREVSKEIDVIRKNFFQGKMLAKPLVAQRLYLSSSARKKPSQRR